jgi:hypothetical protein
LPKSPQPTKTPLLLKACDISEALEKLESRIKDDRDI